MSKQPFDTTICADDIPARLIVIDSELAASYEYGGTVDLLKAEKSWLQKRLDEVIANETAITGPNQRTLIGMRTPIR